MKHGVMMTFSSVKERRWRYLTWVREIGGMLSHFSLAIWDLFPVTIWQMHVVFTAKSKLFLPLDDYVWVLFEWYKNFQFKSLSLVSGDWYNNKLITVYSLIYSWYRGNIKRADAERELLYKGQNCNGLFLIRESESKPGDYSLSIRDEDSVKHYRIRRWDDGRFYIAKRVCTV